MFNKCNSYNLRCTPSEKFLSCFKVKTIIDMVSSWCYFILPMVLLIGLLRKCRERTWGRCKSTSNLQGQVFLVTGANSGIGKETVKELAKRRATIIMACRDMQNAKNVIVEIRNKISTGELVIIIETFVNKIIKLFSLLPLHEQMLNIKI